MNCKQCGAPIKVGEGRDFFHCDYCGCYDFPDPNLDGVALLDEISPYSCPICHQPLVSAVVKNVPLASCPHCRGNLISQSKIIPILRQAQPVESKYEELNYPQSRSELTRSIDCPSCKKTMSVYPYAGTGNVILQGCEQCRLVWLDFGELSRIIRSFMQIYKDPSAEL